MEILTPGHELWHDFILILTSEEYLDFHLTVLPVESISIYYHAGYQIKDGIAWFCEESKNKPFAREVLQGMGNIDVEATLAQWPDLCDCQLVFQLGNDEEE